MRERPGDKAQNEITWAFHSFYSLHPFSAREHSTKKVMLSVYAEAIL